MVPKGLAIVCCGCEEKPAPFPKGVPEFPKDDPLGTPPKKEVGCWPNDVCGAEPPKGVLEPKPLLDAGDVPKD